MHDTHGFRETLALHNYTHCTELLLSKDNLGVLIDRRYLADTYFTNFDCN